MNTSNETFAKTMKLLARPASKFRATATYDRDGDCIEFLTKIDAFYAERLDDLVTVYFSQETDEVIGSLIKGVSKFFTETPGLRIIIEDGRIKLDHLFLARLISTKSTQQDMVTRTYRKLIDLANDTDVETDLIDSEVAISSGA